MPSIPEITVDQLNDRINSNISPILIDVRDKPEFYGNEEAYRKYGHIPNARCIPIMELSDNLEDLSSYKEKEMVTICPGGGMSLIAVEIMVSAGFIDVKSLTGGMDLWFKKGYPTTKDKDNNCIHNGINSGSLKDGAKSIEGTQSLDDKFMCEVHKTLDVCNLSCPLPILKSKKALKTLKIGQVLEILATDPGSKANIPNWVQLTGQELLASEERGPRDFRFLVKRMK